MQKNNRFELQKEHAGEFSVQDAVTWRLKKQQIHRAKDARWRGVPRFAHNASVHNANNEELRTEKGTKCEGRRDSRAGCSACASPLLALNCETDSSDWLHTLERRQEAAFLLR
jgi:hypothetical protein